MILKGTTTEFITLNLLKRIEGTSPNCETALKKPVYSFSNDGIR